MNLKRPRVARRLVVSAAACLVLGGSVSVRVLSGQNAQAPEGGLDQEFTEKVLPHLAGTCMACHNEIEYAGDLSMEGFYDPKVVAGLKRELWEKVHDMLASGKMPPRTADPLPSGAAAAIMGWIEKRHGIAAVNLDPATADPGRVTARRLNRLEYNNTIRDLLGVTLSPADEFPVDDSGYGFDNIGDVLTLSPMLMEKYMTAARRVSRVAVYGESYPEKPEPLVRFLPKKDQDDLPAVGTQLPFAIRGGIDATYRFPVDAEYEFRWRYQNFRTAGRRGGGQGARGGAQGGRGRGADGPPAADGPAAGAQTATPAPDPGQAPAPAAAGGAGQGAAPPALGRGRGRVPLTAEQYREREEAACAEVPSEMMVLTVDGEKKYEYAVRGSTNCEYSRGETVVRVRLTAGDHDLRISWPALANLDDPLRQYNPSDNRRILFVDYLDVIGPFDPSKAPPASFRKIFVCGSPGHYSAACARQIIENLATRAFRRPATTAEVNRLVGLVENVRKDDSFEEGVRVAIQAILVSPNFLFRIEADQPVPSVGAASAVGGPMLASSRAAAPAPNDPAFRISDYELASRLSYFLWSTMPDDQLFALAKAGRLHDRKVLDTEVKRMLVDPRASALVENFGEQWLNLRLMDRKKPDAAKFRLVDDELLGAMREETRLFLGAVFQEDRSILDLIDGKFTFVNGPLARFYGIAGVDGEAFQRVTLDGEQRSGILTQASVLSSVSSFATRTSPVLRGKWVLDNILGSPPPPPPDDVPALVEANLGEAASMRERLTQHRANPACAACHDSMDPIGFALENYDASGAWRTKDGNFEVDSSATLPDGRTLNGAKGLKQAIRERSDLFVEHFIDRLMTFGIGRGLYKTDRPFVQQIAREAADHDYRFSAIVSAIVNSRPFLMRSRVTQ
jgi:hypothetical protein